MPDTTILSWITAEVDQALDKVRSQLASCSGSALNAAALSGCPEHLHQVSGALSMVGLNGATRFCEALEITLTGLDGAQPEAAAVIDRAVVQLREFVGDVARGEPEISLRLYPAYRELSALQGRSDTSEADLFFPDLTPPAPSHPSAKSLEAGELASYLQAQRTRWQRAILAWLRRQPNALEEMRETLDGLHAVAHLLPERRALWWVAGGLVDALQDTEPSGLAQARALLNKIDLYIRDLAAGAQADNEPLLRRLLYAIACSAPLSQRLRDVKRLYALDALVPAPASQHLSRDSAFLQEDARSKLHALRQGWQQYLGGERNGAAEVCVRADALNSSAMALGEEHLAKLAAAVVTAVKNLPKEPVAGSDFLLLEMASAFLLAQSILENSSAPAADTAKQVELMAGWLGDAAPGKATRAAPDGLRPELTQHVSALQLRARVASEIVANLQIVEQALDAYARGQAAAPAALEKAKPQLRQIHGALMVLGWDRAAAVLESCEQMIGSLAPDSPDLDWIAEGLSTLGMFVAPCVQGREPRMAAIDVFVERFEKRAAPSSPAPSPKPAPGGADDGLLDIFLEEAVEVLANIAAALPTCRAEPSDLEALATVRRGFHTLKGSGRMVGLDRFGDAAWEAERLLNQWLERQQPATPELVDFAAAAHERFTAWVAELQDGKAPAIEPQVIAALSSSLAGEDSAVVRVRDVYVKEAAQHAAVLRSEFEAWRAKPPADASAPFTRAAHTLASCSRTARYEPVADLAAELEQWAPLAARTSPADTGAVAAALEQLDAMVGVVSRNESPSAATQSLQAMQALRNRLLVPPRPKEKRVMRDDLDSALLPVFLEEAYELVAQIGTDLRGWKANARDRTAADALKRGLHTLKGSARMAGAIRLGELTHLMESRIEYALEAGEVTAELFDELQGQMDRLSSDLEKLGAPAPAAAAAPSMAPVPAPAPMAAARPAAREHPPAVTAAAMLRISAERLDRLITEAGEAAIARSRIEAELRQTKQSLGELNDNIARLRTQLREVEIQADSQMQSRRSELAERERDFDPLEFDRYTRLQELTRMMAEGLNDATTLQQTLVKNIGETDAALLQQARIGRELQQDLMRMRAVPFSNLAERLHRLVRQTARELGRKAELAIEGAQVELDRGVLERMAAPLEHMLRNALVHGIEDGAARTSAGKAEAGRIAISLRQQANEIVIVVNDDGAGLDLARLRSKALDKGLITADQATTEAEQVQLVFMSGLSTARAVSELAGRGVGMDVVRTEIQAIGGRIEVATAQGRGTTFTVSLPLTLAVTQTVMVRAGATLLAVSSTSIEQVLRVKADALVPCYEQGSIEFQGRQYPLHYLRQLVGVRGATDIQPQNMVLLVRSGAQRIAVHVDELLGNREMVVKSLGPQLARMPGVGGATVLPDGAIVLIINPVQLAQRSRALASTTASGEASAAKPEAAAPLVMVVDDSLTVRKITGRLLEREGYRVLTAKDGLDALEQLKGELPAILLVDIEMPRMDGFDLTRNVRGDPRTMEIPIVMISSRTAPKHRSRAAELGVNVFLGKPYEESELLQQISTLTRR